MPDIYIRHPLHGEKVCHSINEADYDKSNGWVEFDPSIAPPLPVVSEVVVEPVKIDNPVPDFFNVISKGKKKP